MKVLISDSLMKLWILPICCQYVCNWAPVCLVRLLQVPCRNPTVYNTQFHSLWSTVGQFHYSRIFWALYFYFCIAKISTQLESTQKPHSGAVFTIVRGGEGGEQWGEQSGSCKWLSMPQVTLGWASAHKHLPQSLAHCSPPTPPLIMVNTALEWGFWVDSYCVLIFAIQKYKYNAQKMRK